MRSVLSESSPSDHVTEVRSLITLSRITMLPESESVFPKDAETPTVPDALGTTVLVERDAGPVRENVVCALTE